MVIIRDLHAGQKDYKKKARKQAQLIKKTTESGYKVIPIGDFISQSIKGV